MKTILITGSTDGIGLGAATVLSTAGHTVILHGRNADKLAAAAATLTCPVETELADLVRPAKAAAMAQRISERHARIDAVLNNAGVFQGSELTEDGIDPRFAVNVVSPRVLTQALLPVLAADARVVNTSSAAQVPVCEDVVRGHTELADMKVYGQSKLALTMWTMLLARQFEGSQRVAVAVNPGSLLATKMVTEGFGIAGNDINRGIDILVRAAVSDEFADANGRWYDNDAGQFDEPHADARNDDKLAALEHLLSEISPRTVQGPG